MNITRKFKSQKLISTVLLLVSLLCSSIAMAASLVTSVDRNVLSIAESFSLKVEAKGMGGSSEPDFSMLENDFEILSRNVSHNYQSINGVNSRSTSWRLQLMAKRTGELQIPSFNLDGQVSQAIVVKVAKQKISAKGDADFDLVLLANKRAAIAQEQIVVTLRFSFAKHVSNLQASELVLDNAQAIKLNDKQYETRRNGRHFGVYEVNYAVFASGVGDVVIPAQKIQVQLGRGSIFNNSRGKTIALQSDPLTIEVLAAPQSSQSYVVADSLNLQESWAGSATLTLGESITREININLSGAKAETIAALTMSDIEGIKIYPEVAIKKEKKTDEGLETTRARSFALVPTKAGKIVVPAFEIRWWNTRDNKFETARLPEKTIEVLAAPKSEQTAASEPEGQKQPVAVKVEKIIEKIPVENPVNQWLMVVCGLLVIIVLGLLWVIFVHKKSTLEQSDQNKASVDLTEQDLYANIMAALKQKDDALIYHSSQRWALHLGLSLQCDDDIRDSLSLIEQQLYSTEVIDVQWDKQVFTAKLEQLRKKSLNKGKSKQVSLSLYPDYSGVQR